MESQFILQNECTLMQYTPEVQSHCEPFSCGDKDLDEFFEKDVFLYEEVMKKANWYLNSETMNLSIQE